jgi:hypothetical protein
MASCAELLTPLYDLMVKRILLLIVVHTHDTTVPVLDRTMFAIPTWSTTTHRVGRETVPSGSSSDFRDISRPTPSQALTGSVPVPA